MEIVSAKRFPTRTAHQSTFFFPLWHYSLAVSIKIHHKVIRFFRPSEQKHFRHLHILTQKAFNYVKVTFLRKGFFLTKIMVADILKIYFIMLSDEIYIFSNHHFQSEHQDLKYITHFFFQMPYWVKKARKKRRWKLKWVIKMKRKASSNKGVFCGILVSNGCLLNYQLT